MYVFFSGVKKLDVFFFFSSRRRHTRCSRDWSSDVCSSDLRAGGRPSGLETCRIGDIEIDFRTHQAHRGGQRIDFTAREFDLLRYLVAHTGQVVTREQILNQVWGYEESPTTRTIDNFVAKLRQKIEKAPHEPEHILTVHGAGYKFVG